MIKQSHTTSAVAAPDSQAPVAARIAEQVQEIKGRQLLTWGATDIAIRDLCDVLSSVIQLLPTVPSTPAPAPDEFHATLGLGNLDADQIDYEPPSPVPSTAPRCDRCGSSSGTLYVIDPGDKPNHAGGKCVPALQQDLASLRAELARRGEQVAEIEKQERINREQLEHQTDALERIAQENTMLRGRLQSTGEAGIEGVVELTSGGSVLGDPPFIHVIALPSWPIGTKVRVTPLPTPERTTS